MFSLPLSRVFWYHGAVRFHVNVGNVDGLTRALGGVPLVIGALLTLPRVGAHTAETLALWLALLVGIVALLAAFAGHCSWYAGVGISTAVWIIFALRHVPLPPVQLAAAGIGVVVGLYGLYTRATRKCAMNYLFKVTQPHGEDGSS